jgi:hypothetical protein
MRRLPKILLAVGTIIAIALLALARPAGSYLGAHFAGKILAIGKGKISSPDLFVTNRMFEAGFLLSVAILLVLGCTYLFRAFKSRQNAWIALTLCVFAACNLWLLAASKTALFWAGFYTGSATSNQTQFSFKKELLDEHRIPLQAILLGSSQTQAQIDENILNARLQGKLWTTELHFPGSHALDMLLVLRRLRGEPGDQIICYLSEYYFYTGLHATTAPYFVNFSDISTLRRLGWGGEIFTQPYAMGFLADALPIFACREPLSHRVLGIAMNSLEQVQHDSNLETNLVERAAEHATIFKLDRDSDLQKAAFREFVAEAARQNREVLVLEGQVNPILGMQIAPAIRADMQQFLQQIAREHSHVRVVHEKELPEQPASAYQDLTHVTKEVQKEFSAWLASYLEARSATNLAQVR